MPLSRVFDLLDELDANSYIENRHSRGDGYSEGIVCATL